MDWIDILDSHSRVNKSVNIGGSRMSCLLFAYDLVRRAFSEQGLHQHALDRLSAACNQAGMKISTKRQWYFVSSETQTMQCMLQESSNTLQ